MIAYKDSLKQKVRITENKTRELIWLISILDFYLAMFGFRINGYKKYSLSFPQWLDSIKGDKVDAIFSKKDLKPFLQYSIMIMLKLFFPTMQNSKITSKFV